MKDEIKEILECLKEEDNYWSKQKHEYAWPDYYSLNREDLHILLDYITNLQERNNNQETMLRKIFGICYGNYSYNKKVEIIRAILNGKEDEIFYE